MIRATLALLALCLPVAAEPPRVLSIGGSVTEIIFALGQGDLVVARDTTSSFPARAQDLPDVGYMRALSPEGVLSVRPDLILAEKGSGPPETIDVLQQAGIPLSIIPDGHDPDALFAKINAVAAAIGAPEKAATPINELRDDLERLAQVNQRITTPKRVMFILSLQGGRVMAAGQDSGADSIIRLAGATNAVQGFTGYKPLTDEAISAAAPDVILMMTRGATSSDHDAGDADLFALPAISTTAAARDGAVIRMDGLYLLGFGPRTGQAALDLHHAIYEAG